MGRVYSIFDRPNAKERKFQVPLVDAMGRILRDHFVKGAGVVNHSAGYVVNLAGLGASQSHLRKYCDYFIPTWEHDSLMTQLQRTRLIERAYEKAAALEAEGKTAGVMHGMAVTRHFFPYLSGGMKSWQGCVLQLPKEPQAKASNFTVAWRTPPAFKATEEEAPPW